MSLVASVDGRAFVVGSGPNGLAGAITLANAGLTVTVYEAADRIGGGLRTEELTLPGFRHDTCSTVYPFAAGSPFLRTLPLGAHGLDWVHAPAPLAHPLDGGRAAILERSVRATAARLDGIDGAAYVRLMEPLVDAAGPIFRSILGPVGLPESPFALARFGLHALRSARGLLESRFAGEEARALLAGCAAHSMLGLTEPASASFALFLAMAGHAYGWPFARGGASALAESMAGYLRTFGGTVQTGRRIDDIAELPPARHTLLDVGPWNVVEMAAGRLPEPVSKAYRRFRPGPGVVKVDYALDAPVPWEAPECARAGTVHAGGTLDEVAASEEAVRAGTVHERPFVLVTQPTLFDELRAPAGKHVAWAYCHVPNGWTEDVSDRVDAQIERFAPGFRDRILARHVMLPKDVEAHNTNYLGGDISTGSQRFAQLLTRPRPARDPYATGIPGVAICSAATPPGAGVHGMSGHRAARAALGVALADRLA